MGFDKDSIDPRLRFLLRRTEEACRERFGARRVRMLDVGCADGSFMLLARGRDGVFSSVEGVDVPSAWSAGSRACDYGPVYMENLQAGTGRLPPAAYGVVTLWEVVEHIENAYALFRNLRRLLIPGGFVLLSTPNLSSLSRYVKGRRWIGVAEPDHKYLYDPLSIEMMLTRAGFADVRVSAFFLPSLGPSMDRVNRLLALMPGGGMMFAVASARD